MVREKKKKKYNKVITLCELDVVSGSHESSVEAVEEMLPSLFPGHGDTLPRLLHLLHHLVCRFPVSPHPLIDVQLSVFAGKATSPLERVAIVEDPFVAHPLLAYQHGTGCVGRQLIELPRGLETVPEQGAVFDWCNCQIKLWEYSSSALFDVTQIKKEGG